jgi:hypothetical protein
MGGVTEPGALGAPAPSASLWRRHESAPTEPGCNPGPAWRWRVREAAGGSPAFRAIQLLAQHVCEGRPGHTRSSLPSPEAYDVGRSGW